MATFVGGHNTFQPVLDASRQLRTEFFKDPGSWPVTLWANVTPVNKMDGLYLRIDEAHDSRRVNYSNGAWVKDYKWPDGDPAPIGGSLSHDFVPYRCERNITPFKLGNQAVQQAEWEIITSHSRGSAHKMMTIRTLEMLEAANTAGNWGTHYNPVDDIVGAAGKDWLDSTTSLNYIAKTINYCKLQVRKDTDGAVSSDRLALVIGPETASQIRTNAEVLAYMTAHSDTIKFLMHSLGGTARYEYMFDTYGLPPKLFGVWLIVDETYITTSRVGATETSYNMLDDPTLDGTSEGNALMVTMPTADERADMGPEGGYDSGGVPAGFATCNFITYSPENFLVEVMDDVNNKRTLGRVVDTIDPVISAPLSGYLIQNVLVGS